MRNVHGLLVAVCFIAAAAGGAWAQNAPADQAAARAFLVALNAGQWYRATARFDATMKTAAPPAKLAAIWSSLGFRKRLGSPWTQPVPDGGAAVFVPCQFASGPRTLLISFNAAGQIRGFFLRPYVAPASAWRPPDYAHPDRFHERPLAVTDGRWKLPGTVTIPDGQGPFPGAVLVAGSGPNDQDESVEAQKPFKDLAWGLASRGIVVLRYPKRTHLYATLDAYRTVKQEYLDDVHAAIAELAALPEVNPRRVYLIGHSEGGYLAPRIAAGDRHLAGIVIMAGNSRPIQRIIVEQNRLAGATPAQMAEVEALAKRVASGPLQPDHKYFLLPGSYWLDLRSYNAGATAAGLKIPILVLQGARDFQVYAADFAGWKQALAGHPNAQFRLYPGLTHLFAVSTTPGNGLGSLADYAKPGHVAPEVVADIAAWIESGGAAPIADAAPVARGRLSAR